jgi:hypothetical protein
MNQAAGTLQGRGAQRPPTQENVVCDVSWAICYFQSGNLSNKPCMTLYASKHVLPRPFMDKKGSNMLAGMRNNHGKPYAVNEDRNIFY